MAICAGVGMVPAKKKRLHYGLSTRFTCYPDGLGGYIPLWGLVSLAPGPVLEGAGVTPMGWDNATRERWTEGRSFALNGGAGAISDMCVRQGWSIDTGAELIKAGHVARPLLDETTGTRGIAFIVQRPTMDADGVLHVHPVGYHIATRRGVFAYVGNPAPNPWPFVIKGAYSTLEDAPLIMPDVAGAITLWEAAKYDPPGVILGLRGGESIAPALAGYSLFLAGEGAAVFRRRLDRSGVKL